MTGTLQFELFTWSWTWLTLGCTFCYLWGQIAAFVWYEIVRDLWTFSRDVGRLHVATWTLVAMMEKKAEAHA